VKDLATMIDDLERLHEADLTEWERGFVKNVANRTAMDRAMGTRLQITGAQAEAVETTWKKHFSR
jgi:hypothetical protein